MHNGFNGIPIYFKFGPRTITPRTISPSRIIAPGQLTPRIIAPQKIAPDNCPPDNCAPDNCPPSNFPRDNGHQLTDSDNSFKQNTLYVFRKSYYGKTFPHLEQIIDKIFNLVFDKRTFLSYIYLIDNCT